MPQSLPESARAGSGRTSLVEEDPGAGPRFAASDFYGYLKPSRCGLRVWLREQGAEEEPPGEMAEMLMRLGIEHEHRHLARFPHHLDMAALPREEQRAATIVLQKSVRESFGLGAAEAMWKGKPVVGGSVGGLTHQIVYDVTGYTVHSVEGAAFRLRHLLNSPELIARMGAAGREHVRRSYLVTRQITEHLALLIHLTR